MPGYKVHVAFAFLIGIILIAFLSKNRIIQFSFLNYSIFLFFVIAGALFPDIDIKSKGQIYFYKIIGLLILILLINKYYFYAFCFSILSLFPLFIKHRGITHKYWFSPFLILIIIFLLSLKNQKIDSVVNFYYLSFIVGNWTHIFLDRIF